MVALAAARSAEDALEPSAALWMRRSPPKIPAALRIPAAPQIPAAAKPAAISNRFLAFNAEPSALAPFRAAAAPAIIRRAAPRRLWLEEHYMRGEPGVVDYLNKGLRHELTAVNQYWLHYRLLDNWGYKSLAKKWRKESIEEMEHADTLIERIIFLDGFPNMQVLDPLHIGQSVKEVLECDLQAELHARALYEEAATHCHSVKDYVSRDLFEKLMHDEEEHIDFLETQLDLVAKLGAELYAQHHIGKLDDDDHD
jgi:bacterioferritin